LLLLGAEVDEGLPRSPEVAETSVGRTMATSSIRKVPRPEDARMVTDTTSTKSAPRTTVVAVEVDTVTTLVTWAPVATFTPAKVTLRLAKSPLEVRARETRVNWPPPARVTLMGDPFTLNAALGLEGDPASSPGCISLQPTLVLYRTLDQDRPPYPDGTLPMQKPLEGWAGRLSKFITALIATGGMYRMSSMRKVPDPEDARMVTDATSTKSRPRATVVAVELDTVTTLVTWVLVPAFMPTMVTLRLAESLEVRARETRVNRASRPEGGTRLMGDPFTLNTALGLDGDPALSPRYISLQPTLVLYRTLDQDRPPYPGGTLPMQRALEGWAGRLSKFMALRTRGGTYTKLSIRKVPDPEDARMVTDATSTKSGPRATAVAPVLNTVTTLVTWAPVATFTPTMVTLRLAKSLEVRARETRVNRPPRPDVGTRLMGDPPTLNAALG
jgi:uncharacterized DUF497 family protein